MKAFILAAGLGTRLAPFTLERPKALVELNGITLLERAIRKVNELEVSEIVINVHHFGDQILEFLKSKQNFNLPLTLSDERDQLLDTGGALLKAKELLGSKEPFLLYNVDVLSTIDLKSLSVFHLEKGGLATLAVRERPTDRYLLFDQNMMRADSVEILDVIQESSASHPIVRPAVDAGQKTPALTTRRQ